MKKIVLISASVLALGAASIAADADGLPYLHTQAALSATSASASLLSDADGMALRGSRVVPQTLERKVRLVSGDVAPVKSCDAAHWPYYPESCLARIETAGL